jgi:chromosome segregation ATPase
MSFMKKDVNLGLLFIVILLAVCFAALGIYYNQNYIHLSTEYSGRLDALQETTDQLLFYKSRPNQTTSDLELKEQDESVLNERFTELRSEKETLETQKANLQTQLSTTKSELLEKTNQLLNAQSTIASQKTDIEQLTVQRDSWERKYESADNKLDAICNDYPTHSSC